MTPTPQRKIIHIDADSFYASVEMREHPEFQNKPLAVGGQPGSRGVIATCNYLARRYGVHSAMASSHAVKLCPDLIFRPPNFELYREISGQIRAIMTRYTDIIEPLSLDEAYLDVTDSAHLNGSATRIAQAIRNAVKHELRLTVSAGVAPNKFLAKIASDWQKPDALFVITPAQVEDFVAKLPVGKINGVGKVTNRKLHDMGIDTCADLSTIDMHTLVSRFGRYGTRLYQLARGIDDRPVESSRIRKSISVENTYLKDLHNTQQIEQHALKLYEDLCQRAGKLKADARFHKRYVKVKFDDFSQTTLEETLDNDQSWQDPTQFRRMLIQAWKRSEKPVRLLGIGLRLFAPKESSKLIQLDLFKHTD